MGGLNRQVLLYVFHSPVLSRVYVFHGPIYQGYVFHGACIIKGQGSETHPAQGHQSLDRVAPRVLNIIMTSGGFILGKEGGTICNHLSQSLEYV